MSPSPPATAPPSAGGGGTPRPEAPVTISGVLIETAPGAAPRVAARLLRVPGLTLHGSNGTSRIAAVLEGTDGGALERLTEELLAADDEILGVFPTFVAKDGD